MNGSGAWHARHAWLGGDGLARDVTLVAHDGRWVDVTAGSTPPRDAVELDGVVLPGFANVHSHAFHRALRGRAQHPGDFWKWREAMYRVAEKLDPQSLRALAAACFGEMVLAGFTVVGEFHYVHHAPDGRPYDNPHAMTDALVAAAADAGIRITLLDTCYLQAGFDGAELDPLQRRFSDGSFDAWAARAHEAADEHGGDAGVVYAAAIHSVRAVGAVDLAAVAAWADEHETPLHVHVSEQRRENEAALAAAGRTPVGMLDAAGALRPGTTLVHATHLRDDDVEIVAASGADVCLCTTTERDLGDGLPEVEPLARRGVRLTLGTDSHAVVDAFAEMRGIEHAARVLTERRGVLSSGALLDAATASGADALGWGSWGLAPGNPADLVAISTDSPRLAGWGEDTLLDAVVHGAFAEDVAAVVVGGRAVVRDGLHTSIDVPAALHDAITSLTEAQ